jgi:hypothetical protein
MFTPVRVMLACGCAKLYNAGGFYDAELCQDHSEIYIALLTSNPVQDALIAQIKAVASFVEQIRMVRGADQCVT